MSQLARWPSYGRQALNWGVIVGSVLLCLLVLPTRFPGMSLLDVGPNWLLIWVVTWSVKRTMLEGAIAGLTLGLIQDGMTAPDPTHALSLVTIGVVTARLQKQRYIQEDFISIALIVFGMSVLAETITAFQFSLNTIWASPEAVGRDLGSIWLYHQRIALTSAILSSLWAPVIYYPLNHWWERFAEIDQPQA